jgi:two-component system NarL family sensor kinase
LHPSEPFPREIETPLFRISRFLQTASRVLLLVELPPGPVPSEIESAFLRLANALLQHNAKLAQADQRLAARVMQRRSGRRGRIVERLEVERQRLGRELHTGVGQALAATRLQLELIGKDPVAMSPPVRDALDRIAVLTEQALAQVRSVSHRLHPPEWQRLTLKEALQQLWATSGVPQGFDAAFTIADLPEEPSYPLKILLYRSAQEAISNLIRHSGATRVTLTLTAENDRFLLRFMDNGKGFDSARVLGGPPHVAAGLGLRSLRDQIEALGGQFLIHSDSNGTTLEVSVPMHVPGDS